MEPLTSLLSLRCEMSGECIDYARVCNNHEDCADGSDEHGCKDDGATCPPDQFSCDDAKCVPDSKVISFAPGSFQFYEMFLIPEFLIKTGNYLLLIAQQTFPFLSDL